ncbi:MAG: aminotransferase class I/II-fold pyridoxal phosphate-dependent enzyme, partial [Anaerotignum sp.]|nr:aminotransferase class I/II-fold pyridoxal phosphate-dependent enzyme [Anaerotignum sp.]
QKEGILMYRTLTSPQGGRIILDGKEVINMASNNYLGLANHPDVVAAAKDALEKYGVATTASRNICGNYPVHDELEEKLAKFKNVEAVLVFNCGVSANSGLIPQLVGKGDFIYSDELNHGSIIDGCRLSGAKIKVFRHMDMAHLEELLQEPGTAESKKLIITDGVFSMDGDLAPLPEMADLADKYGAELVVDDAHGDGIMGPGGRGTVDHFGLRDRVRIETGSLSKAFGSAGGFVAGPKDFIEALRPKARSFIFTASPMAPCLTAAAAKAVDLVLESDELVKKLWDNRNYFAEKLEKLGLNIGTSVTPVIPIIVGDAEKAQELSRMMYERGVYAQALQFPMVPRDTARLRTIISADHTKEDLDQVLAAVEECAKELGLIK